MPQITINITHEQQAVLDGIHDPYLKAVPTQPGSQIQVYDIKDDNHVVLWAIDPDGSYRTEELIGFGEGWTEPRDQYGNVHPRDAD